MIVLKLTLGSFTFWRYALLSLNKKDLSAISRFKYTHKNWTRYKSSELESIELFFILSMCLYVKDSIWMKLIDSQPK